MGFRLSLRVGVLGEFFTDISMHMVLVEQLAVMITREVVEMTAR